MVKGERRYGGGPEVWKSISDNRAIDWIDYLMLPPWGPIRMFLLAMAVFALFS